MRVKVYIVSTFILYNINLLECMPNHSLVYICSDALGFFEVIHSFCGQLCLKLGLTQAQTGAAVMGKD